ncbi:uncharacterized protein [Narcine bancroftii]|uniref:uncharacterized protein isoform X2 n=1 Tax=Narcine bancroftii TaxID=1343680 RepID=UPI0038315CD5
MAACGYVLLLSCIVGNVWCHQKDHSKKLLSFPKAEQKKYSLMPLVHRKRYFVLRFERKERMLWLERLDIDPQSATASNDFKHWVRCFETYLQLSDPAVIQPSTTNIDDYGVPESLPEHPGRDHLRRSHEDSKEDLVWDMDGENRRQFMNKVLHYESFEEMFSGLEDEKIKQANKYHKAGHALSHEHGHENEHKHNHEHNPTVNRDDYWIVGKRRFRIIVLIILAVLVGFAILLILAWFFLPRKLIKKIRDQK